MNNKFGLHQVVLGAKGLEIKVAFNGVWKQSLSELSGGKASIVSL